MLRLMTLLIVFQSTLLMRGATRAAFFCAQYVQNFNPRSSCEERLLDRIRDEWQQNFNPRSSCEERLDLHLAK